MGSRVMTIGAGLLYGLFFLVIGVGAAVATVRGMDLSFSPSPSATPTKTPRPPSPTATLSPTPTETPMPTSTFTPMPTSTSEPIVTPTSTPPPSPTPGRVIPTSTPRPQIAALSGQYGFGYGIQAHAIGVGWEEEERVLGALDDLGITWVKQQVEWFRVEPQRGAYDWGGTDGFVDRFGSKKILFSVVKAPSWAESGGKVDAQAYADFIGAMAKHYQGRVQAYEVWNEHNILRDGPLFQPQEYVDLLCLAYQAIKANDPGAVVVAGALTPTGVTNWTTAVDDAEYLRRLYQIPRFKGCFDALGVHPSGFNNPPDVGTEYRNPNEPGFKGHRSFYYKATMQSYRDIMVANGDGGKQLWPTEFGWASTPNPVRDYEYAANNTPAEQAERIVTAFELAQQWGWVGPMFLWNLNFGPVAPGSEMAAFGIVDNFWQPMPAYFAVRQLIKGG